MGIELLYLIICVGIPVAAMLFLDDDNAEM